MQMTKQMTKQAMTLEQFEQVKGRVDARAEMLVDDEVYDNLDTALEFAWEMVYADIKETESLEEWARDYDMDPALAALDRDVVADGTKFDDHSKYIEWCREHHGTE